MYENIFIYNFIPNFLFGFFFIIINILFSIKVSKNNFVKKIFFFNEFQPIIIYFLIFSFYVFIFNITIFINYKLISKIFFIIFLLQILFIITNLKNYKSLINFRFKIDEKLILSIFFILFLISILPLTDADSISIYQYLPATILNEGLKVININQNLEFTLLSNTEVLLLISSILKSDNFGSQLNLVTLLFFIIINFKKHKNFSLIILSSPLLIYFISAQKLQLFFGILFLLSFVLINKDLLKKQRELFIFILLLTFYSSGKLSYILFTVPLFIYFFYVYYKNWKIISLYSIISFVIVYFPLLALKQNYFGNILAPFCDNLLGQNLDSYNAFAHSIRSSEGWMSDPGNFSLYIRPFLSLDLSKLSSSLGLVFLLMLIDFKLQKKTKFLSIILIILVLATGQIVPRYYFEAFLILAYYYQPKKFFVKLFVYSQVLIIFFISVVYIYFAYIKFDVVNDKLKYMNKFSYSFFNAQQLKKDNLNGNVLDFSLDRHSIFFDKNVYSLRYLQILNKYKNNINQNLNDFILNNSIKYLIIDSNYQIPDCLITKEIKETYRKLAVRNFLIKPEKNKYKIIEIRDNKCTY